MTQHTAQARVSGTLGRQTTFHKGQDFRDIVATEAGQTDPNMPKTEKDFLLAILRARDISVPQGLGSGAEVVDALLKANHLTIMPVWKIEEHLSVERLTIVPTLKVEELSEDLLKMGVLVRYKLKGQSQVRVGVLKSKKEDGTLEIFHEDQTEPVAVHVGQIKADDSFALFALK